MKIIHLLYFSFWCLASFSQPSITWQKCLGGTGSDRARFLKITSDGGYIMAAESTSSNGDVSANKGGEDYWVVKTNSTGTITWEKNYGGTSNENAIHIIQSSDGGYVVVGQCYSSDGDVSGIHQPGTNPYDNWIVKLDASGNILWSRCNGGTDWEIGNQVYETPDGGLVSIYGAAWSPNDGDVSGKIGASDFWITKQNSAGTLLWQKCLGGTGEDYARGGCLTSDGGFVLTGRSLSNDVDVSGWHGSNDAWTVKIDSLRVIQWQNSIGGSGNDRLTNILQTTDGGYILVGATTSNDGDISGNHGNFDGLVVKLDASGNISWLKCLGGTGADEFFNVNTTSDGGYILIGTTASNNGDVSGNHGGDDVWAVKLSSAGAIQWQLCMGGTAEDAGRAIEQNADGGFILARRTASNNGDVSGNHGSYDMWLVKLGTDPVSLPIELVNFDVDCESEKAILNWTTASETNNDFFTVERSIDAKTYEPILQVEGKGNSTIQNNYNATDYLPLNGVSYYRLKQTDFDGKCSYSSIVTLDCPLGLNLNVTVFPNPINFKNTSNVSLNILGGEKDATILVVLHDVFGKEYYSKVLLSSSNGLTQIVLQSSMELAKGIYIVSASSNNKFIAKKLVVE